MSGHGLTDCLADEGGELMDDTEEKLKELVELARLYDVYGSLLNDHSKGIFERYILDNYSLGEISEEMGISRQGVRDIVVRYSKKLHDYENRLKFLEKLDKASDLLDELDAGLEGKSENTKKCIDSLRNILES